VSNDTSPIYNVGTLPRVVPVVTPASEDLSLSGKVRNLQVRGVDTSGWLAWDPEGGDDGKGDYAVIKRGYTLLRDLYRDENNEAGWQMYKRYIKDWQTGKTIMSFPTHLLPKKVQDMQTGLVGADKPDPWRIPAPKPTTGKTVDIGEPAPAHAPSRKAAQ